ncbi:hypothetical protein GCM10017556_12070 [Micromonospora sagamiensis]|nr:hypothetical protein GCM10017556_12070 [Micromonospora sagamiensis]
MPKGPSTTTQLLEPRRVASRCRPSEDRICSRPTNGFMNTTAVSVLENRPARAVGTAIIAVFDCPVRRVEHPALSRGSVDRRSEEAHSVIRDPRPCGGNGGASSHYSRE